VRARSSVSCYRSCRTRRWTQDTTIESGDAAVLRRSLEDAHTRIAALERAIAATRGLESLGRRTLSIAHDFRNVMAAIGAQTELLLDVVPAETPQRRRVEAIRRASDWGARLAHGLLAAGGPPSTPNEVTDLNTVVSGVVRTLAPSFGNIDVQTQLEPRIGTIAAGAAALEQIAMNLILNARDAMPGGGRMTIRTALAGHRNGASAEAPAIFSVEDTGIGMDEATRARAFEPYFTTKAADKGMGLGLSIVHDIVTRHGGHVNISSAPGRGTTLTVTLPRAGGEARDAVVLVLVDEAGVRDLIVDILELHEVHVCPARDPLDAERLVAATARPVALVIADASPLGWDVRRLEALRGAWPTARVLYLVDRASNAQMLGIGRRTLAKPFSVEELVRTVRAVLNEPTD